jgi:threonine synthase
VAVSDDELFDGMAQAARDEGIFFAPEAGACVAALQKLKASGHVSADDRIVLFNTGTGSKYVDALPPPFDGG